MTVKFPISTIVTVSVTNPPTAVNEYNTSNLALFTDEASGGGFDAGLGYALYSSPAQVGIDFGTSSRTYQMAVAIFSQNPNILLPGGQLIVILLDGDTLGEAITRTQGTVQYFGVMQTATITEQTEADVLAAAAIIQALPLIGFFVSYDPASVAVNGTIDKLRSGLFTQSRGLYYQDSTDSGINAMLMMAAYAGRLLSVVFSGSLTTITMNLKQLATILPDPNIDATNLALARTAGADVYISIQGSSEVLSSGENQFVDNVYNQLWLAGALQVQYFNYLAQTSTKILQTEDGMNGLKGALRQIMLEAVGNGYLAPGSWNSPTTFGNLTDFQNNITQFGFYIYSTPVAQQTQANREDRIAPLVQIAAKLAGAIQSGSVIVVINP